MKSNFPFNLFSSNTPSSMVLKLYYLRTVYTWWWHIHRNLLPLPITKEQQYHLWELAHCSADVKLICFIWQSHIAEQATKIYWHASEYILEKQKSAKQMTLERVSVIGEKGASPNFQPKLITWVDTVHTQVLACWNPPVHLAERKMKPTVTVCWLAQPKSRNH